MEQDKEPDGEQPVSSMLGMSKKHGSEPNITSINPEAHQIQLNQSSHKVSSETSSRPEFKRVLPKMDLESPKQKLRIIKMLARKPENR